MREQTPPLTPGGQLLWQSPEEPVVAGFWAILQVESPFPLSVLMLSVPFVQTFLISWDKVRYRNVVKTTHGLMSLIDARNLCI